MPQKKIFFAIALAVVLVLGFIATSVASYFVTRDSLTDRIAQETLPLTSDNIYSEIEQDLLRSVLISSLMAHDTFVKDWALSGEQEPERIIRYLEEIQQKYDTTTAFFVSEQTRKYYHPSGVLETVEQDDAADAWYFRVRDMNDPYEINIDTDTADPSRLSIFVNFRVVNTDGDFIGATGIGLSVESVGNLIDEYQQRYGRDIYFVDRKGEVRLQVDGTVEHERIQERPGLGDIATKMLTSPSSSLSYTNVAGETVYVNTRLIPELDWLLVVEQSEATAEPRILNTLLLNIGVALGITLLVFAIAWFTIRGYHERLEEMATTDSLTGTTSRQVFGILFDHDARAATRSGSALTLLEIDIDGFKPINDTYGHQTGDAVLRMVANTVREHIRDPDTICRWGGDEFLVLLGRCDGSAGQQIAEKIRAAIAKQVVRRGNDEIRVTVSIGVAKREPGEELPSLNARCDAALYEAKREGRDRVAGS